MGVRSTRVVFVALLLAGASFAACEAFDATPSETSDAGADASDASIDNTSASTDTSAIPDAGTDGRLFFDSFESDIACAGWIGVGASSLNVEAVGRTGKRSCLVCLIQNGETALVRTVPGSGPGVYQLEAWTRAPAGDAGLPWVSFVPTFEDGGRSNDIVVSSNALPQSRTMWTAARTSYPFGVGLQTVALSLKLAGKLGDCILIDDVELLRAVP